MYELTQLIIKSGIPEDILVLILMFPIVATIIAFSREVVGVKGFGIYTSLIIAFAFYGTGLIYGIVTFILVLLAGTLIRLGIKHFRLLYLPRMAIVLTGVAFIIFLMFLMAGLYGQKEFLGLSIFPILIIITLIEKFVAAQIERGARTAVTLTVETLLLAIISYFIVSWTWLQDIVLAWPLAIFLGAIIFNIILGKWTGLRLTEYLRFRELIKYVELPTKK